MTDEFYDEQEEQSAIKTAIVVKYFRPWTTIILSKVDKVGYLDLYCGPGKFKDGTKSTPLLILEQIAGSERLKDSVVTTFNDHNPVFIDDLKREVSHIVGIEELRYEPKYSTDVGEAYEEFFENTKTIPLLCFLDPWGYKGLTRKLIEGIVKGFGSEVIFFFNYSRINAAIQNDLVEPHVGAIFGEERLVRLREVMKRLSPEARESLLMQELGMVFEEIGAPYLIPFRIQRESGQKHYICFVSKHPKGYEVMKDIMAGLGIKDIDGVPQFQYLPAKVQKELGLQFDSESPILALPGALRQRFRGQALSVGEIFKLHNVGTPFIRPNYKMVLKAMEDDGEVVCDPPKDKRKANSLADHVIVTFKQTR
jgi:three-Cys-motif partner protein